MLQPSTEDPRFLRFLRALLVLGFRGIIVACSRLGRHLHTRTQVWQINTFSPIKADSKEEKTSKQKQLPILLLVERSVSTLRKIFNRMEKFNAPAK